MDLEDVRDMKFKKKEKLHISRRVKFKKKGKIICFSGDKIK